VVDRSAVVGVWIARFASGRAVIGKVSGSDVEFTVEDWGKFA